MKPAFALLLFGLLQGATGQTATDCSFPGKSHECAAPGGHASIEWRESGSGHLHELWLRLGGAAPVRLLEFNRHVDVLWAPGAQAVAITDHEGSSDSVVWVATLGQPPELLNAEQLLVAALGRVPVIFNSGHRYFIADRWSTSTSLVFEVAAYDELPEKQYRGTYELDLAGKVKELQ